jgi:tartrate-resistant acid phosphatase type 5
VFIDTTPLIEEYYKSADYEDVKKQDTTQQRKWLQTELSDPSLNIKRRNVVEHHPLYTGGKRMNGEATLQLN